MDLDWGEREKDVIEGIEEGEGRTEGRIKDGNGFQWGKRKD